MKPLGDRVLVMVFDEKERTTDSGLVVPNVGDDTKPLLGSVIEVGDGYTTKCGNVVPLEVSVGDEVLIPRYGITEVNVRSVNAYGEKCYLVRERDILAIVKKAGA